MARRISTDTMQEDFARFRAHCLGHERRISTNKMQEDYARFQVHCLGQDPEPAQRIAIFGGGSGASSSNNRFIANREKQKAVDVEAPPVKRRRITKKQKVDVITNAEMRRDHASFKTAIVIETIGTLMNRDKEAWKAEVAAAGLLKNSD
jgi:hypothetical protein